MSKGITAADWVFLVCLGMILLIGLGYLVATFGWNGLLGWIAGVCFVGMTVGATS